MSRDRRVAVTAPAGAGQRRVAAASPGPLSTETLATARRIRRAQLRRVVVVLLSVGALLLLGLPVLIHTAPWLSGLRLFGISGGWLAVAVLPYPVMAALAWAQLAAAEHAERPDRPPP